MSNKFIGGEDTPINLFASKENSHYIATAIMKTKPKYTQIEINFTENTNIIKHWWMGIPCEEGWWFNNFKHNIKMEDQIKPWHQTEYQETLIKNQ